MLEIFDIPQIISTYGYLGIAIIVFLESGMFFALPGDSLLFTAGILAASTYLRLYYLIPLVFVSTFFGAIVGYYIGMHIERLRKFSFFKKILKEEHLNKAHVFFEKHGKLAIIFSRFIPIVRTFMPIAAGVAKMNYISFIKHSLVSSIIWATLVPTLGYFLGQIFPQIKDYMSFAIILVVLVSLLPAVWEVFRKKIKN